MLASIGPIAIFAQALAVDFPVMLAVALACLPVFFTGHLIARREGVLYLACYALHTTWFLPPLTAIALGVTSWRWWRREQGRVLRA